MDSASSWGPAPTTTPMPANMQGSSVTSRPRAGLHARWVYCDVGGLTLYDPFSFVGCVCRAHIEAGLCSQRGGSPPLFCCRVSIGRGCARYRALDSQKGRRPDGATTHESSLSVISAVSQNNLSCHVVSQARAAVTISMLYLDVLDPTLKDHQKLFLITSPLF